MRRQKRLSAPLRRKCEVCKNLFRANRADAEFCSAPCRQSAYRDRKSKVETYNSFKASLQIAQNTHDDACQYEFYRSKAVWLHKWVESFGIEHVKFVATPIGIIVIGDYYGARAAIDPDDWDDWDNGGIRCPPFHTTEYDSGDAKIIEAISQRTLFAGSILRMEHEQGDAEAIQTPAERVLLLTLYEDECLGRRTAWGSPSPRQTLLPDGQRYGSAIDLTDDIDGIGLGFPTVPIIADD